MNKSLDEEGKRGQERRTHQNRSKGTDGQVVPGVRKSLIESILIVGQRSQKHGCRVEDKKVPGGPKWAKRRWYDSVTGKLLNL